MRHRARGIALSDWSNPFALGAKDKRQLQAGQENAERGKTAGAKTRRERAYIAAVGKLYNAFESTPQLGRLLAYRDAMQQVAAQYPDDHEAQIFYALALAASEDPADKTYAARLEAGAILEKLFAEFPLQDQHLLAAVAVDYVFPHRAVLCLYLLPCGGHRPAPAARI